MTKLYKTTTALFLSAVILLGGCAERSTAPAPADTDINTSSDVTGGESSESTGSTTSDISGKPESSLENESNSDSSPEESSDVSVDAVPVEFNEEDRELQNILEDVERGCAAIDLWFSNSAPEGIPEDKGFTFRFSGDNDLSDGLFYSIPKNYSEGELVIPDTYEKMMETILEYFSENRAGDFFRRLAKGSMTEKSDGIFSISLYNDNMDKGHIELIEIDKTMYRSSSVITKGFVNPIDIKTAKLTKKTNDTIEFTYLSNFGILDSFNPTYLSDVSLYEENAYIGVLKYERGGWRRDWDKDDPRRD